MNRRRFVTLSTLAASIVGGAGRAFSLEPVVRCLSGSGRGGSPILSFGLTTDVQYADIDPAGERHYRESIPKLKELVADLAKQNLPFTLHLGDVIERDFPSFGAILPLFEALAHPVRHLLGNHDFSVADEEKSRVISTLGMPDEYYAFHSSGVVFVMLHTGDVSLYKHPKGSPGAIAANEIMRGLAESGASQAKPWNGGVSPAQLEWLDGILSTADAAGEPALICTHHPLLPEDAHRAWNSRDVLAVLGRHPCVRACFSGHYHSGNDAVWKGLPFITFKSVLHEPGVTAYSVVRLFADRLVIEGRGREVSREFLLPLRA